MTLVVLSTLGSAPRLGIARPPLEIRGNVALNDEVYRAIVVLSEAALAAEATAALAKEKGASSLSLRRPEKTSSSPDMRELSEQVKEHILDFLKVSGYDLASVEVEPGEDRLIVEVDEGKLDKIIFVGENFLSALQLKFALALPGDIFNRPLLEEKLERLVEETEVASFTYEVVPVEDVDHEGIQIEEPTILRGFRFTKPGSPHELRVYVTHEVEKAGIDLFMGLSGIDGLHGSVGYSVVDGILHGDRTRLEVRAGVHLGEDYRTRRRPIGLARLRAAAEWLTPPVVEDSLRLRLDLDANLGVRQRQDIEVARYWYLPLKAALNAEIEISPPFTVSLGAGVLGRFLARVEAYEGVEMSPVVGLVDRREVRAIAQARLNLVLDPGTLRRDRRGRLQVAFEGLAPSGREGARPVLTSRLHLEHVTTFGWNELWFTGAAAYQVGDVTFMDEVNVGSFLRTCFSESINVQRAIGFGLEYRLSLSRDILKVSLFNEIMLHERLDFLRLPIGVRIADDVGVGVHYLVSDLFQVDFYTGLGLDQEEGLDLGFALRLRQAF